MTRTRHDHQFAEVVLGSEFEDHELLRPGMQVLAPCECGETPADEFEHANTALAEVEAALLQVAPERVLFHWAPTERRAQIVRRGLVPHRRATASDEAGRFIGPVCFGTDPSFAWSLSGWHRPAVPSWDLWMTWLGRLAEPVVLANDSRHDGVHEIRTMTRVRKRDLWLVATRTPGGSRRSHH